MKEGEKLDGLAFAQRPIKNEENEGRREGGMREGGGKDSFQGEMARVSKSIFPTIVAHLSPLFLRACTRVHALSCAWCFYILRGQPRNIRENPVLDEP